MGALVSIASDRAEDGPTPELPARSVNDPLKEIFAAPSKPAVGVNVAV